MWNFFTASPQPCSVSIARTRPVHVPGHAARRRYLPAPPPTPMRRTHHTPSISHFAPMSRRNMGAKYVIDEAGGIGWDQAYNLGASKKASS